jgi:hypothetical protein
MPSWKMSSKVPTWDKMIKARQVRLNHKPFGYTMNVKSDFAGKGVVRTFLGPKVRNILKLDEYRNDFWEVDQYYTDLIVGNNVIKRFSKDFFWSVKDRTTYSELYRKMMMAIDGKEDFIYDMSEAHCGFPDRLLLPKGNKNGKPFTLYFIITKSTKTEREVDLKFTCGVGSGKKYFDDFARGYPFDRQIDLLDFMTPNMYFKDVLIDHMDKDMNKDGYMDKDSDTDKYRDINKYKDINKYRDMDKDRYIDKNRDTDKYRDINKYRDMNNDRDVDKNRDMDKNYTSDMRYFPKVRDNLKSEYNTKRENYN